MKSSKPNPCDFEGFLPWACKQYEFDVTVFPIVQDTKQSTTRKMKTRNVRKRKVHSPKSICTGDIGSSSTFTIFDDYIPSKTIEITAIFDNSHNLIGIKIDNNEEVSRKIIQVIALIIEFYPSLTSISANQGLDTYCIYEITKILPISSITEVCLDGTRMKNPNYDILLETVCNLRYLSLAKCEINEGVLQKIAEGLTYPRPGSQTLTYLNVSSNRITDDGVAYLADALKTNRHLAYLNVADNHITDIGASHIFDILLEFPILNEDLKQSRLSRRKYFEKKNKLFHKFVAELQNAEGTKFMKRKGIGKLSQKKKKPDDWAVERSLPDIKVMDVKFFEKAEILALQAIGPSEHPFQNVVIKDGIGYCEGNNTLTCLNLAYNNLSYASLQKLIEVLNYQNTKEETPRGLFRVRLEGNYLPSTCEEYTEINRLLNLALEATSYKPIKVPKKINGTAKK